MTIRLRFLAVAVLGIIVAGGCRAKKADPRYRGDLLDAEGGVLMVVRLKTPASQAEVIDRIRDLGFQPDFAKVAANPVSVLGLTPADPVKDPDKYLELAVIVAPGDLSLFANPRAWADFAQQECRLLEEALHRQQTIQAASFDASR